MPYACIDQAKSIFAKNSLCLLMSLKYSPLARSSSLTKSKVLVSSQQSFPPTLFQTVRPPPKNSINFVLHYFLTNSLIKN